MKKFFKSMAVACSAMVGMFVCSCNPEDINTTFDPSPAEATITVTVIDAETGNDVSSASQVTTTASNATVSGNVVTIKGNNEISAQIVTVSASYNGQTANAQVAINHLLAGGKASYSATVVVGKPYVPSTPAKAVISYSVKNLANDTDVTSAATVKVTSSNGKTYNGANGVITITGEPELEAQTLTVSASYSGKNAESQKINLPAIKKDQIATYALAFTVGEPPVTDPATATIHVSVFDGNDSKDVTKDAEISAVSTVGGKLTVTDGKVVISGTTAKPAIEAQSVEFKATYNGKTSETSTVVVAKCEAGTHVSYNVTLVIPADEPVSYDCIFKQSKVTKTVNGLFVPTHYASHSHDGSDWAYNESEFILDVKMTWTSESGIVESECNEAETATPEDKATAESYLKLIAPDNYVKEDKEINFKVSAFAMYTLLGTKTYTTDTYEVVRIQGADKTVVATLTVLSVATQVEPKERAIPGHEGHYGHGHGHADDHGYGSNAGGGIVWAD